MLTEATVTANMTFYSTDQILMMIDPEMIEGKVHLKMTALSSVTYSLAISDELLSESHYSQN